MTQPLRVRAQAHQDIVVAAARYRTVIGRQADDDFQASLTTALDYLAANPWGGSLETAIELGLPALRSWPIDRFPHVVYYRVTNESVDVWRVLHLHHDVPSSLRPAATVSRL